MTLPDLETEALRLDPRERAHLAHVIVASLSDLTTDEIQDLWLDEAERRDAELESGDVAGIPTSGVFARIRDRHS